MKNTCTPVNVYGGFDHTLFLGCSVIGFSASGGWNEQVGELTVQLVEDTCTAPSDSPKHYWDLSLDPQTTTDADPGFFGESFNIIGAPVYFRVGEWEFSGIIQSWDKTHSESGNPAYVVKIVDPRQILEGTQLIIGEYAGSVGSVYNLFNVFGYAESTGLGSCVEYYQSAPGVYAAGNGGSDGATFGSPATKFGGADQNQNGMQWNQILNSMRILTCSFPAISNQYSPYGRVVFKAPSSIPASGMGLLAPDSGSLAYYALDLEEVPAAPSYWRFNGTNIGLLDAISQICNDSGHDYYLELIPVKDVALGAGVHKFIKVRTVDRVSAPALNAIDTFVAASGREVKDYRKGRELRNEITSTFVIGGPKQNFYQAEQSDDPEGDGQPTPEEKDDIIIPFFGVNPTTGNVIIPVINADDFWEFNAPTDDIALQLANPKYNRAIPATVLIDERELIAAADGLDMWLSYVSTYGSELYTALDIRMKGLFNIDHIIGLVNAIIAGGRVDIDKLRAADIVALRNIMLPADDPNLDLEVMQIGFAWIEKFAKEYYGRKFQVRVPFTCGKLDTESGITQLSDEPTDGGWTEVTPVLGLTHPSIYSDFFLLDDNRLGAFCRYDDADTLELSGLAVNDFVSTNNKAWIKIDVMPQYVYVDTASLASPRVVITLPEPIKEIEQNILLPQQAQGWKKIVDKFAVPVNEADKEALVMQILKAVGGIVAQLSGGSPAIMPDAAGFGIKSNVLKYGPWGSAGPAGAVNVVNDEGLVPWEYGGFTTLNLAGLATAAEGVTNTQVTEEGSITVAGYPTLPLGAELLAADGGGPFNGGGNNLIENRSASSGTVFSLGYYYVNIYPWNGSFGPNVTGITTQVGSDGLTTTYTLRTWTPKFGVFSKGNSERLKQYGKQRFQAQKDLRAWTLNRIQRRQRAAIDKFARDNPGIRLNEGAAIGHHTPHEVLVGQLLPWNNNEFTRPVATTSTSLELPVELANDYTSKAFMSLDGLVRPVSNDGSGGLPRFIIPGANCQTTTSRGAQPPIDKPGQAGSYLQYNIIHSQDYLNPLANPGSALTTDRSNTPDHGHDIEMIGRGTGVPPSSMVMPIGGYGIASDMADSDYDDSYRFLALKGPLVIQSWGYDLDGFPVPNEVDDLAAISGGVFESTGLTDKFLDNWLRKSETWPVAPLDIRLDRERGVWTIPQYRDVVARLKQHIAPSGNGLATQISGPTLYDNTGAIISEPELIVYDEVGHMNLHSGNTVIASYDPYDCKYRIIENKGGTLEDIFKFRLLECVCIDFAHRPEGYAEAMRLSWNETTKEWEDQHEVKLYTASCNGEFGPGASGLCGWAKIPITTGIYSVGSEEYLDYHSPTGSGGGVVISMEEMAQFIDFATVENVGCVDDVCLSTEVAERSARANIYNSWNGKELDPADDVIVYFGRSINLQCLNGVSQCGPTDETFTYTGTAVFDRQMSSDAICYSNPCRDTETCGKWVYRVVDLDNPMTATDVCCTGDYNTNVTSDPFYKIVTRTGIKSSIDGCNLVLDSDLRIVDTNDCFPPSGYPRIDLGIMRAPEVLNFGAGMWVTPGAGDAAYGGISFIGAGCPDTDRSCVYHIQAGFRPYNNKTECLPTGMPLTSDGGRFINVVDFQGGLYAADGPNSCDLLLRAGIEASTYYGTNLCGRELQEPVPGEINHKIKFGKGLILNDEDHEDCQIELAACTLFSNAEAGRCVSGLPFAPDKFNYLALGKGLMAQSGDNPCVAVLGAGFGIGNRGVCVTGDGGSTSLYDNNYIHSKLLAGEGLKIAHTDDCEATIGLHFNFGGVRAHTVHVGSCLTVSGSNCEATINFANTFNQSGVAIAHTQYVISDIDVTCCPTNGAVKAINYTRHKMEFNACGQLIYATNLGTSTVACTCGDSPSMSPSVSPSDSLSSSPSASLSESSSLSDSASDSPSSSASSSASSTISNSPSSSPSPSSSSSNTPSPSPSSSASPSPSSSLSETLSWSFPPPP